MIGIAFLNREHARALDMLMTEELAAVAARFPVGARVLYRPVIGWPEIEASTVRSGPWVLGHGAIVLKIVGRAGGVSVEHLTLIGGGEH